MNRQVGEIEKAIRSMVLVCVKKGYQPIVDENVSYSLAIEALSGDNSGGRVMNMVSEPVALAEAA